MIEIDKTVEQCVLASLHFNRDSLTEYEREMVQRWKDTYRMEDTLIYFACRRVAGMDMAMSRVDSLLLDWSSHGVHTYTDYVQEIAN